MTGTRATTLDGTNWQRPSREQDDEFRQVQVHARKGRWAQETELLKETAMRLARENGKVEAYRVDVTHRRGRTKATTRYRGGFTMPEVAEEAELTGKAPSWLLGAIAGWLSDQGMIQVGCGGLARENSSNGTRKGSKINRWELAERAIAVVPEPGTGMPAAPARIQSTGRTKSASRVGLVAGCRMCKASREPRRCRASDRARVVFPSPPKEPSTSRTGRRS